MHIPRHYRTDYHLDGLGSDRPGCDDQFAEWMKDIRNKRAEYQKGADAANLNIPPQKPSSPLGHGITLWTAIKSMADAFVTHRAYEYDNGSIVALCFTYRVGPKRAEKLGIWVPSRAWIDCPECHEIHDHASASMRAVRPLQK